MAESADLLRLDIERLGLLLLLTSDPTAAYALTELVREARGRLHAVERAAREKSLPG
jgi:hypothetical protein